MQHIWNTERMKQVLREEPRILEVVKELSSHPTDDYYTIHQKLKTIQQEDPELLYWIEAFFQVGREIDWYRISPYVFYEHLLHHLARSSQGDPHIVEYLAGKIHFFAHLALSVRMYEDLQSKKRAD